MFRYAYGHSDIQLKERIDSKRGIEGMFSADNFDFYSNFWNIEKKIECILMINTSDLSKIKYFEETIIDFAKYLKNLYSK